MQKTDVFFHIKDSGLIEKINQSYSNENFKRELIEFILNDITDFLNNKGNELIEKAAEERNMTDEESALYIKITILSICKLFDDILFEKMALACLKINNDTIDENDSDEEKKEADSYSNNIAALAMSLVHTSQAIPLILESLGIPTEEALKYDTNKIKNIMLGTVSEFIRLWTVLADKKRSQDLKVIDIIKYRMILEDKETISKHIAPRLKDIIAA